MGEMFAFPQETEKNRNELLEDRAKVLLEKYHGENGEIVFSTETFLLDEKVKLELPTSYMAFPLSGMENSSELSMLRQAIQILDNLEANINPFYFTINYDIERKVENGKTREFVLMTNEDKIRVAEKVRVEAIAFAEKWANEEKRQNLYELAAQKKECVDIQSGTQDVINEIEAAYKAL